VVLRQCLIAAAVLAALYIANAIGGFVRLPLPAVLQPQAKTVPTTARSAASPQQAIRSAGSDAATQPSAGAPAATAAQSPAAQSRGQANAPPSGAPSSVGQGILPPDTGAQSANGQNAPAQNPAGQGLIAQNAPAQGSPSQNSAAPAGGQANPATRPFGYADVVKLAQERAAEPYEDRSPKLPTNLAHLTYEQYQDIRFRSHLALWRNQSLFEVQFFHRGFNFDRRVEISEVVNGVVHPVHYTPSWFDFGKLAALARHLPTHLGFAGFRVHYPLQTPTYKDELIVFLGASYFRVLGRNEVYGQSARGLAVNTASTKGEEFPWFTDFWLVRPATPEQRTLTLYALLDSQSLAGAYQFDVLPGNITQVTVTSELFPRKKIAKLGVAPLTSMFLYGEDPSGHRFDDYRPQVHDSDGLQMQTGGGEWLWRPLLNPKVLQVNRFMDEHPRGFGLSQRDRSFSHYQDSESQFERRPSYWIQPLENWGKGGVELVEIPTDEEIHDNIVAYWVPSQPMDKPVRFDYVLSAYLYSPGWPPGGRVIATRSGDFALNGNKTADDARRMLIDYAGGDLEGLDGTQPVRASITASGGRADQISVQRLPETGTWRVAFRVVPADPKEPVDLRCYLTLYGEALTETWTYQLITSQG
jgi:periplasmic glucans biosynthesis protein